MYCGRGARNVTSIRITCGDQRKNIDRKATGKHKGLLLWKKMPIDFVGQKGRIYQLSQQCMMLVDYPKRLTFLCSSLSNWRDLKWRPNGQHIQLLQKHGELAWIFVEVRLNMMEDRRYAYSIITKYIGQLSREKKMSKLSHTYTTTPANSYIALKKDRFRKNFVFQPSFLGARLFFRGVLSAIGWALRVFPYFWVSAPKEPEYHRATFLC